MVRNKTAKRREVGGRGSEHCLAKTEESQG